MLTAEENQRLTEIGPGTSMGKLLRWYWQPIAATTAIINIAKKPRITTDLHACSAQPRVARTTTGKPPAQAPANSRNDAQPSRHGLPADPAIRSIPPFVDACARARISGSGRMRRKLYFRDSDHSRYRKSLEAGVRTDGCSDKAAV